MESARELAELLEPGRQLVDRLLEQIAALGRVAQAAEIQQDRRQSLLCAVVEIALDALALRVRDLDEARSRGAKLLLGFAPVGDVAEIPRERRQAGQRDSGDRQLDGKLGAVPVHGGQLEPTVED